MNAFNPITTMQKLEAVGMDRRQAETLADEFHHATTELVTKDELTKALDAQANIPARRAPCAPSLQAAAPHRGTYPLSPF